MFPDMRRLEVYGNRRRTLREIRKELEYLGYTDDEIDVVIDNIRDGRPTYIVGTNNNVAGGKSTLHWYLEMNGFRSQEINDYQMLVIGGTRNWGEIAKNKQKLETENPMLEYFEDEFLNYLRPKGIEV